MLLDFINRLRRREEGQALVEYALILSLIAVFCIGALTLLGQNVNNILNTIAAAL
jgi:pilus assembly protein Flp/PilA